MCRKRMWGWMVAAVAASTVLASAVWASAPEPAQPDEPRPADEAASLDCGGGMVIVYHDDYVPKSAEQEKASPAAKSPDEAVARLVREAYPGAARERAFRRVPSKAQAQYVAANSRGQRAAVLTVAEQDGSYYVEEVAICENLAQRWAR